MRVYTDERATTTGRFTRRSSSGRGKPASPARRAVVGFGEGGDVQRASILDLSGNLPLVVERVGEEAKLRALLDTLVGLTDVGLVTLEAIEVMHYGRTALPAL